MSNVFGNFKRTPDEKNTLWKKYKIEKIGIP
jgi:hypothetical protein